MFTALTFGLCALMIEGLPGDPITRVDIKYPAVGIGIVAKNQCRVELFLIADTTTPGISISGGKPHRFKVEKVDHSTAVIWVDAQSFTVPRPSF
jgi:hypothetical protein